MKHNSALVFSLLLLLALPGCISRISIPGEQVKEKISSGKSPLTIVWFISPERTLKNTLDFLEDLSRDYSDLRLVAALPGDMAAGADEDSIARLVSLAQTGKITLAAQLHGSLPLPLLAQFRDYLSSQFGVPDETLETAPEKFMKDVEMARMVVHSEELWSNLLTTNPIVGLVLPMGAYTDNTIGTAFQGNSQWILTASSGSARRAESLEGKIRYEAFGVGPDTELAKLEGIAVFDEAYMLEGSRAESMLREVARKNETGEASWELVDIRWWSPDPTSVQAPAADRGNISPLWGSRNSLNFFWGSKAQAGYWTIMNQTLQDILKYQNSGQARLEVLDKIWEKFWRLLSYSTVKAFSQEAAQAVQEPQQEKEFLSSVTKLYEMMAYVLKKKPKLGDSLWEDRGQREAEAEPLATAGLINQLEFRDAFDPPADSSAATPVDLEALQVGWTPQNFIFRIKLAASVEKPYPFELYIDLNHRAYAGKGESLDNTLRVAAKDFWEYLLAGNADGDVTFYRYGSQAALQTEDTLKRAVSLAQNAMEIWIPRSWIAGKNPGQWGWALCVMHPEETQRDCFQYDSSGADMLIFARGSD